MYEDNGWRRQWREEGIPPPTPIEPIQKAIGEMYLAVAQRWNSDVDLKKLMGREIRSLEDVAAELWVIQELNRLSTEIGENLLQWEWKEPEKVG